MKEFRFLNYSTEYLASGDIKVREGNYACFSDVFNKIKDNKSVHYEIIMHKGIEYAKENGRSNACLFTKQEVKNHISILSTIFPLNIKVIEKAKTFTVILDIKDVPGTFHKYALTWTRYLYEYPYNVLLKDAYMLKKNEKVFMFESIANLFNLAISCFCDDPRDIHQIPNNRITEPLTKKELREQIKKMNCLNDLYKVLNYKDLKIPEQVGDFGTEDIEYWSDPKIFNDSRKPIYLKVYSQIHKKN